MDKLLAIACFLMAAAIVLLAFPEGAVATILVIGLSLLAIQAIRILAPEEKKFLIRIFLAALLVRLSFGLFIYFWQLQGFFGGDAETYDTFGNALMTRWFGGFSGFPQAWLADRLSSVGWGMYYLVAAIYSVTGRNILAAQSVCAVVGAATAPLVYQCAHRVFKNRRVAVYSALIVAFYPALVVWSGQLLKDGIVVFLLVLSMTMALKLREKFSGPGLFVLLISLFCIFSVRSYIFYMVAVAIAGMFVISLVDSRRSIAASFIAIILLGVSFTYLGALDSTSVEMERYTDLEQVQRSRSDLQNRAGSGFGDEVDVSTTRGAIQAIPVGFIYLMLAPFPWQVNSVRQAISLPDILIWWLSIPLILTGLVYSIRHRLRPSLGILVFTLMLTLAYSIFQGNVGTAYRQRTQIQVFLFMFAAVGITLRLEKRENREMLRKARRVEAAKIRREREATGLTV